MERRKPSVQDAVVGGLPPLLPPGIDFFATSRKPNPTAK
jgi:hypothetical protein